jgi:hypothetical protein
MARNAGDGLDRFDEEVAVERLVEARGIGLARKGDELVGLCVLCEAGEGLRIDRKANSWSCRSCGEGGGPVEWVMASRGVSRRHAIELLREGATDGGASGRPPKRATTTQLEPLDDTLSDDELLAVIVAFYHRTLLESAEPSAFLSSRALANREAINHFRLGYSNRTLGLRVPAANRKAGRALRRQLQRLGVWSDKGHEAFAGSLVVPVVDVAGQVVQLYGRKVRNDLRKGTRYHTWLASDERPLFNAPVLLGTDEVILAGSVIDALSFWCAGFRHVVGVDSVEGFDPTHLGALVEHGIGRVLIGFRRDEDGETAAKRTAEDLMGAGVECFRLTFPHGMDANDFVRSSANPTDAIHDTLRGAVWMGKGTKKSPRGQPSPEAAGASPTPPPNESPSVEDLDEQPAAEADEQPEPMLPAAPLGDIQPELGRDGDEMRITFGDRSWRVRGLAKNTSFDVLRVNVLVSVPAVERGQGFHVDTLDLYSARARASFAKEAAEEIGVEEKIVRRDLGRVFMAAEGLVDEAIRRAQEPTDTRVVLDDDERAAALELLRDPQLVERVVADFARVGMVGESTNCLVGYLATVSRLLDRPLAVIVQSTSAAGKSALMDAVLDFVPNEDLVRYSAMTGQSLYYLGEHDLAHKVLAIAEEEGAERASYPLKLLQSEGEVSIASTGKDNATGRLVAHPYRVKGPAAIFLTTTAIDVDEELRNRCVVLTVDEDRAQTRGIHDRQRRARTLDGILARNDRSQTLKVHRDAQRLLEPVAVVNPFADRLTFVDAITRTRRDHVKYLTLIDTIALLHQHQRERKTATTAAGQTVTYIEATVGDIALANRLAHDALGHSLDELPPQTRRLLTALDEMVTGIAEVQEIDRDRVRFTRRQARERLGLGDTQLKVHLARLVELELVWAHRAERSGGFVYELAWSSDHDGDRFLPGLVDAATLTDSTTATEDRSGQKPGRSGGGRPPVAGRSGPGRDAVSDPNPQANGHEPASESPGSPECASGGGDDGGGSNTHDEGGER